MIAVGRDFYVFAYDRAVEQKRVEAVLAIDGVVVVTRIPDEHVVAFTHICDIVTIAADHEVGAVAADELVGAGPAPELQLDLPGQKSARVDHVGTTVARQYELVERTLGVWMCVSAGSPETTISEPTEGTVIVSLPAVPLTVTVGLTVAGAAAYHRREVEVHPRDVGTGHVVDDDFVGAAERVEVDPLDIVQVHGDGRDVADKAGTRAVGRDIDVFAYARAVE